jgi:hypothetical protein
MFLSNRTTDNVMLTGKLVLIKQFHPMQIDFQTQLYRGVLV